MSTVMQPVGPREPRIYWMRRAVVVGVPLVILILVIAVSCSGGGGKKKGSGKHPTTHVTTSASTSSSPSTVASPVACDPKTLTLTLKTNSSTNSYTEGQTPQFTGIFKNPGTTPCSFTLARANEAWLVKSGAAQIWATSGCTTSKVEKAVTIKAGGHKKVSITWDGKVQKAKCTAGDTATNGTYTLAATLDGVSAASIVVFHITS
jgi:hypothetical protein